MLDFVNWKKLVEKLAVTFVEAAVAYWVATGHLVSKTAIAGAIGAGVSAVYNLVKQYRSQNA